jgi:hypothetical protein
VVEIPLAVCAQFLFFTHTHTQKLTPGEGREHKYGSDDRLLFAVALKKQFKKKQFTKKQLTPGEGREHKYGYHLLFAPLWY